MSGDGFLIKNWATNLEQGAVEQAINAAKLPCVFRHVAVMPDGHQGMSFPIGGVMALKNAICVNAIGVDQGCGMCTCKTSIKSEVIADMRIRRDWLNRAKAKIPVGEGNSHRGNQEWARFDESPFEITDRDRKNLGTLGGGNHFASLEQTQDGYVQLLLHSGSRNLGHRICTKYSEIAETLCRRWFVKMEDYGLSFLPIGEKATEEFIKCLNFALGYAKENRSRMMLSMQEALQETLEVNGLGSVKFSDECDVHHNYAALENHFGENVWIHRKGATSAKKGETGIIPGSMGTAS